MLNRISKTSLVICCDKICPSKICIDNCVFVSQIVDLNGVPHRMIRNWHFKTSKQHRNEVPCTEEVWDRINVHIQKERPLLLGGNVGQDRVSSSNGTS